MASKQGTTWSGNIGLIAHSDYLRANSDMLNCGTNKRNYKNYETCPNTDWMYISGSYWWTISSDVSNTTNVCTVSDGGSLSSSSAHGSAPVPRPATYLKSDITLSGSGTLEDPFTLSL